MIYKVFVDTNVFLDHLLMRPKELEATEQLFQLAVDSQIIIFTSSSSIVNIIYALGQQKLSKADVIRITGYLLSYTRIAECTEGTIISAINSGFPDLEDAIQYYTALKMEKVEYFVTSNLKDYRKALPQLPVVSARQLLQKIM